MAQVKKTTVKPEVRHAEPVKFKGKYLETVGKRKTAVAQIRLYQGGEGNIIVNQKKIEQYFNPTLSSVALAALRLTGQGKNFNFSIQVKGGGKRGQADAVRHGLTRALLALDDKLRPALKAKGFVTRDARIKERKKPGLKKARRAPQWAKR